MKIISWIIIKLGGITVEQQEETRILYERWAVKHLVGKNGEVTPNVSHYFPFDDDDIVIIRSRISVTNGKIKGLKIAPWCKDVCASGLIMFGDKEK